MELINLFFGTKIFIELIKLNLKTLLNLDHLKYLILRKVSYKIKKSYLIKSIL